MRASNRWAGLLLVPVLGLPAFGADPPKAGEKPAAAESLVPLGELTGVLKNTAGSEAGFTLHITLTYVESSPGAALAQLRDQEGMLLRQRQIVTERNPVQRTLEMIALVQEVQHIQYNWRSPFGVKQIEQDIEIRPARDMKVRSLQPPAAFDEKGNPRKYTPQELKELRGNGKLPGYAADPSGLQDGQVVTIRLARRKEAARPRDKKAPPADERLVATRIVIIVEPQTGK
jgi:hypothetical protein